MKAASNPEELLAQTGGVLENVIPCQKLYIIL